MPGPRALKNAITILSAKAADGEGIATNVSEYQHAVVQVIPDNSAEMSLYARGAILDSKPDFAGALTVTNSYAGVLLKDLGSKDDIDGESGYDLSGSDTHKLFEVNINGLKWLNFVVDSYVAGDVTVIIKLFKN